MRIRRAFRVFPAGVKRLQSLSLAVMSTRLWTAPHRSVYDDVDKLLIMLSWVCSCWLCRLWSWSYALILCCYDSSQIHMIMLISKLKLLNYCGVPTCLELDKSCWVISTQALCHRCFCSAAGADVVLPAGILPWDVQVPEGWSSHWESDP